VSAGVEVPEGETVLLEGRFDAEAYKGEAKVSAIVVGIMLIVVLCFLPFQPLVTLAGFVFAIGAAFVAWREYRAGRDRSWALTAKALYLTGHPPVPITQIRRFRGSSRNVRLYLRDRSRVVLLGEPRAIEFRNRLRSLKAGAGT
jgi:hypothetical protein